MYIVCKLEDGASFPICAQLQTLYRPWGCIEGLVETSRGQTTRNTKRHANKTETRSGLRDEDDGKVYAKEQVSTECNEPCVCAYVSHQAYT